MSLDATQWAWRQNVGGGAKKLVLLSMADRAGEDHTCFPSLQRLMNDTELSKPSVIQAIQDLINLGLIEFTGKRVGNGTKVYRLIGVNGRDNLPENGLNNLTEKHPNGLNNLTSQETLPVKNLNHKGKETLPQGVKNFNQTGKAALPITVNNNHINNQGTVNSNTREKKFMVVDDLVNLGIDRQVAKDFLVTRKTKLTQTALQGIAKQAELAGVTLNDAITFAVIHGWQSFKADWYHNRQPKNRMDDFAQQAAKWANFYGDDNALE